MPSALNQWKELVSEFLADAFLSSRYHGFETVRELHWACVHKAQKQGSYQVKKGFCGIFI